jgi:hypothetical protein
MHRKSSPEINLEEGICHPGQQKAEGEPGRMQIHASISTIGKIWGLCLSAIFADLWMGFGFLRSAGWQARTAGLFHALGMILFMFAAGIARWFMLTRNTYSSNPPRRTFIVLAAASLVVGLFAGARLFLITFGATLDFAYAIFIATVGGIFGASSGYILSFLFWKPARIHHKPEQIIQNR